MPGGRPPKIDKVLRTDEEGAPVTVAAHIVERVRTVWLPWEDIALGAGITRETLRQWTKWGGLARAKEARGESLNRNERLYAQFLGDLEKAESEAVQLRMGLIQREAAGGYAVTKTVTKTVEGKVVEKVVTVETARPVWQASAWQLERRRPADFGRRVQVEGVEGGVPIPIEQRADSVADAFEAFLAGAEARKALSEEEAKDG